MLGEVRREKEMAVDLGVDCKPVEVIDCVCVFVNYLPCSLAGEEGRSGSSQQETN